MKPIRNTVAPTKEEVQDALELRHTKKVQQKIQKARVAICGLGGLGSEIAIALGRCGVGSLHLIDFDCVELTNLNRQQYGWEYIGWPKTMALQQEIIRIAPYVTIQTDTVKITEENAYDLLSKETYICEAFDRPEEKAMLTNYILEHLPHAYLVGASGMAGAGKNNEIRTRKILEHYYLCGDGVSESTKTIGLMAPRVMLCAAHQANQILELIIREGE